jgi:hypothetical protein
MRDAREALQDIADALYAQAAERHAEGMALVERSSRIRQLAQMCSDAQAEHLLAALEADGTANPSIVCTADGGEA